MSTIQQILAKLGDSSTPLAHRDLRQLSDLGSDQVADLLAAWRPIGVERRRAILRAMNDLAEDNIEFDFRDVSTAALDDDDATVRRRAAEGLWEDERPSTLRRLLEQLDSEADGAVRAAIALALGHFAFLAATDELRPRAAAPLRAALLAAAGSAEHGPEARRRALESAGYFSGPDVTTLIADAYGSGQPTLKVSALVAVGHNLDERWLPVLKAELSSTTPALRYEAARALGEFGEAGQALLGELLPLVEETDAEIARAAIWALGQIGGPAAKRILERLLRNDDDLKELAEEALNELRFNESGGLI